MVAGGAPLADRGPGEAPGREAEGTLPVLWDPRQRAEHQPFPLRGRVPLEEVAVAPFTARVPLLGEVREADTRYRLPPARLPPRPTQLRLANL